jgi:hypothetical protein
MTMKKSSAIFRELFWGMLLGVLSLATAHHGNPQAPVSPSMPAWYGSLPHGASRVPAPLGPGH